MLLEYDKLAPLFPSKLVISHECRSSTLLANIMISMNCKLFLALLPQAIDWNQCCNTILLLYFFVGKNFTGGLPNNEIILSSNSAVLEKNRSDMKQPSIDLITSLLSSILMCDSVTLFYNV